jgi:hypothetical protein
MKRVCFYIVSAILIMTISGHVVAQSIIKKGAASWSQFQCYKTSKSSNYATGNIQTILQQQHVRGVNTA